MLKHLAAGTAPFFIAIGLLFVVASPASATNCKCRQHSTNAEASGTCSRTEDKRSCTLTFTTTTPEEYKSFVSQLRSFGINEDPRKVVRFALENRPEKIVGQKADRYSIITTLFAISQKEPRFVKSIGQLYKSISGQQNLLRAFANKGLTKERIQMAIPDYEAWVSYGCIELRSKSDPNFFTMIKTRWSSAQFFCDDF